jgi:release factor glutamine methyltransferase
VTQTLKTLKEEFIQTLSFQSRGETEAQFFWLLEDLVGLSKLDYLQKATTPLSPLPLSKMHKALADLAQHRPIQQILGACRFAGLTLTVNEHVLIPRPETEELITLIAKEQPEASQIIDLGTGSGCIALALAKRYPKAKVRATDVSIKALELARHNAKVNQLLVEFIQNDALSENNQLPVKQDIIVSNPPYIRQSEKEKLAQNVVDYEPHIALFVPDKDALLFYRALAQYAQKALLPQGLLALEINQDLGPETKALLEQYGFRARLHQDDFENPRFITARLV